MPDRHRSHQFRPSAPPRSQTSGPGGGAGAGTQADIPSPPLPPAPVPLPNPVVDGLREDWDKRWERQEREELLLELRTLRDDIATERRLLDLERLKPTRY